MDGIRFSLAHYLLILLKMGSHNSWHSNWHNKHQKLSTYTNQRAFNYTKISAYKLSSFRESENEALHMLALPKEETCEVTVHHNNSQAAPTQENIKLYSRAYHSLKPLIKPLLMLKGPESSNPIIEEDFDDQEDTTTPEKIKREKILNGTIELLKNDFYSIVINAGYVWYERNLPITYQHLLQYDEEIAIQLMAKYIKSLLECDDTLMAISEKKI